MKRNKFVKQINYKESGLLIYLTIKGEDRTNQIRRFVIKQSWVTWLLKYCEYGCRVGKKEG